MISAVHYISIEGKGVVSTVRLVCPTYAMSTLEWRALIVPTPNLLSWIQVLTRLVGWSFAEEIYGPPVDYYSPDFKISYKILIRHGTYSYDGHDFLPQLRCMARRKHWWALSLAFSNTVPHLLTLDRRSKVLSCRMASSDVVEVWLRIYPNDYLNRPKLSGMSVIFSSSPRCLTWSTISPSSLQVWHKNWRDCISTVYGEIAGRRTIVVNVFRCLKEALGSHDTNVSRWLP